MEEKAGAGPIDVDPKTRYLEGFLHCAKPFACEVKVRGKDEAEMKKKREILAVEFGEADSIFKVFDEHLVGGLEPGKCKSE